MLKRIVGKSRQPQLENLAGGDDTRLLGYANLVSEMVDTLPDLTIVQLALTSEWMQFIEPRLSLPQKTSVSWDDPFYLGICGVRGDASLAFHDSELRRY